MSLAGRALFLARCLLRQRAAAFSSTFPHALRPGSPVSLSAFRRSGVVAGWYPLHRCDRIYATCLRAGTTLGAPGRLSAQQATEASPASIGITTRTAVKSANLSQQHRCDISSDISGGGGGNSAGGGSDGSSSGGSGGGSGGGSSGGGDDAGRGRTEGAPASGDLSIVLSAIAIVVSVASALVQFWQWRTDKKTELNKLQVANEAAITARYAELADSMDFLAAVYREHEVVAGPGQSRWPWRAVYSSDVWPAAPAEAGGAQQQRQQQQQQQAKASDARIEAGRQPPASPSEETLGQAGGQPARVKAWLELATHLNRLDSFWDGVLRYHRAGHLPDGFPGFGWRARWANYVCLCEPLNIAKYYRAKFDHDRLGNRTEDEAEQTCDPSGYVSPLSYLGKDKRPKRYTHFASSFKAGELPNTTTWAEQFEAELKRVGPSGRHGIDLSGTQPVKAAKQAAVTPA